MVLIQVHWSKIQLVSLDIPENFHLYILLIFVQNTSGQVIYKQTMKHAREILIAIYWTTWVKNAVNSQPIIWFMQGIYVMNHKELIRVKFLQLIKKVLRFNKRYYDTNVSKNVVWSFALGC